MTEIVFQVEEDAVDGGYAASAVGQGIITQGETLEELRFMIVDALKCHFDREEDTPRDVLMVRR